MNGADCRRHLEALQGVAEHADKGSAGSVDIAVLTASVQALWEMVLEGADEDEEVPGPTPAPAGTNPADESTG